MIRAGDISPRFGELLSRAGWHADRRAETAGWVTRLESEGFKPNPTALAILESVGGLSLLAPPAGINPYEHQLRFDPVRAATGEVDRAEGWREELGVDLFPLGEEVRNGNILWAGSDGRIYFGRGFGLYILGDSFGIAMDQLAFPNSPLVLCAE